MEYLGGNLTKINGLPKEVPYGLVHYVWCDYVLYIKTQPIREGHRMLKYEIYKYDMTTGAITMPEINKYIHLGCYSVEIIVKHPHIVLVLLHAVEPILTIVVLDENLNLVSMCDAEETDRIAVVDSRVVVENSTHINSDGYNMDKTYEDYLTFSNRDNFHLFSKKLLEELNTTFKQGNCRYGMRSIGYKDLYTGQTEYIIQFTGNILFGETPDDTVIIRPENDDKWKIISAVDYDQSIKDIDTEKDLIYVKCGLGVQEVDISGEEFTTRIVLAAEELNSGHYIIDRALTSKLRFSD